MTPDAAGPTIWTVLRESASSAFACCSRSAEIVCATSPVAAGAKNAVAAGAKNALAAPNTNEVTASIQISAAPVSSATATKT